MVYGDYSVIVDYVDPATGKSRKVQTTASQYKSSDYPGAYKITRVGGGVVAEASPPASKPASVTTPTSDSDFETRVKAARMGLPIDIVKKVDMKKPIKPLEIGFVKEEPKTTTAAQQYFLTRVEDIKSRVQLHRLKNRIKPDETYYVQDISNKELADRRKTDPNYVPSYRVVVGSKLLSEYEKSYQDYQKGLGSAKQFWKTGKEKWDPGTTVSEVATKEGLGYEIRFPYAGAEHYAKYKKELETQPLSQFAVKLTEHDILGIPSFVESQFGKGKQKGLEIQIEALHKIRTDTVMTAVTSPVALAPWYVVGGVGLKAGLAFTAGKLAARPISSAILTKVIPGVIGGAAIASSGADIVQTYQRGELGRTAGKITGLGIAVVGIGAGYKLGAKVTFKGLTPKELELAKALKPGPKIDYTKLPVLKQIHGFKEYHLDVRIARGMKFGDITQHSYGKLPAYLGRQPYGKKGFVSTLEQMKGTLLRTGWRGDLLKASKWAYYRSINIEPVLTRSIYGELRISPRILKTKTKPFIYMDKKGMVSLKTLKTYDLWKDKPRIVIKDTTGKIVRIKSFEKFPKVETGELPFKFTHKLHADKLPILGKTTTTKITGLKDFKKTKIPTLEPVKTDRPLITLWREPTAVTTQMRFPIPKMVSKGYLKYLEALKPPYETYVYPKGVRIGVLSPTPKGKIISPVTGLITGTISRELYKPIFEETKLQKRWFDFRQLLKMDQRQITDIISEQAVISVPATATISGLKSLQAMITAQTTLTKSLLKQKTATATTQKSVVENMRQPIIFPRTPITPKPTTTRPPVSLPYIPIRIFGRGRMGWGESLFGKKYKYRGFELGSPFKKQKKKKKIKKKGGKKK